MPEAGALELAKELIARRSVTPEDGGCQELLRARLAKSGFRCEPMRFGAVDNLWARRGDTQPLVCFAGHTDVVPPGPLGEWHSDPFIPSVREGRLYGRGAADMKSSIAAFVVACEAFISERPGHSGSIALLLTSDEEGPALDGTVRVVEGLKQRGEGVDYCIVGEPTSVNALGDMIKNGRRGSLSGRLTVRGIQGHIAYPHLGRNPIHQLAPALAELTALQWDAGTERSLKERLEAVLKRHGLDYAIEWTLGAKPFITSRGRLVEVVSTVIKKHTGRAPELSTTGGTSDARFIAEVCPQVVELGPVNASIHKLNEHIELGALEQLPKIYLDTLRALLP